MFMNSLEKNQTLEQVKQFHKEICSEKRSNHHRDKFFPMMIDKMNLKVGAEIGVDKGEFSRHLLSKSNLKELYCIDPWIDDFGSDYRPEFFDKKGKNRKLEAVNNLKEFGDRVSIIQSTGLEASKLFDDDSLDYLYIDGDHSLKGIFEDIYSWTPKVRIGGIVSGHDYKNGPNSGMKAFDGSQLDYNVKTVVDDFCVRYGFKLHTVGGRILSWYFVKV